jgi:tRNA pseudouridine13 synthase
MSIPDWPWLTRDVPALPGTIKARHEDFLVEEVPAYEPSGSGDHVYFGIEKRGLTTMRAVRDIARALGVKQSRIGVAGLKDARGVTRQMLSLEHADPERVAALELPRIRVRWTSRHRNKLKRGHLRGNRFAIKLRQTEPERVDEVRAALGALERRGVPNYYGPQRFGARGDTWEIGRALIRGDYDAGARLICGDAREEDRGDVARARQLFDAGELARAAEAWPNGFGENAGLCRTLARGNDPERAILALGKRLLGLYASAVQSYLFNELLARRIDELDAVTVGELAWKHDNGAVFTVEDVAAEQERAAQFEISPTGPLFGRKMTEPGGRSAALEQRILDEAGLTRDDFPARGPLRCPGARRPLRVKPDRPRATAGADEHGPYLELTFGLPAGSYATVLLREICKDGLVER